MNQAHLIVAPLKVNYYTSIRTNREYWFSLSMNAYRTANHYHTLNKAKIAYTNLMLPIVASLPVFNKVKLTYTVYVGSNVKSDVMNWVSVSDKFFQDVLVKAGKLTDDNYTYVPEIIAKFGGVDKKNPRMEILIEELEC